MEKLEDWEKEELYESIRAELSREGLSDYKLNELTKEINEFEGTFEPEQIVSLLQMVARA